MTPEHAPEQAQESPDLAAALRREREAWRVELEAALAQEREAREEALAAQEHRATVATVNLAAALIRREWSRVPSRAGAFVFAALARPGTAAAVGLVAIATLALTAVQVTLLARQNELLEAQNARVDVQTAVAEAGRRADLAREARAVIAEMIAERAQHEAKHPRGEGIPEPGAAAGRWGHLECVPPESAEAIPELCWRAARRFPSKANAERQPNIAGSSDLVSSPTIPSTDSRAPSPLPARCGAEQSRAFPQGRACPLPDPPSFRHGGERINRWPDDAPNFPGIQGSWYPSSGLAVRLASLTKGLPPHRPVIVREGDEPCSTRGPILWLDAIISRSRAELARGDQDDERTFKAAMENSAVQWLDAQRFAPPPSQPGALWSWAEKVGGLLAPRLELGRDLQPRVRFACETASPERGEILLSLLDAGFNPDAITSRGGDFSGALLSGVRLNGRLIEGIDLSDAIVENDISAPRDNVFRSVLLHSVRFNNTDLRGLRMRNVHITSIAEWYENIFSLGSLDTLSSTFVSDVLNSELSRELILTVVDDLPPERANLPLNTICEDVFTREGNGASFRFPWMERLIFIVLRSFDADAENSISAKPRIELMISTAPLWESGMSRRLVDVQRQGKRLVVDQFVARDCTKQDSLPPELRTPLMSQGSAR